VADQDPRITLLLELELSVELVVTVAIREMPVP